MTSYNVCYVTKKQRPKRYKKSDSGTLLVLPNVPAISESPNKKWEKQE